MLFLGRSVLLFSLYDITTFASIDQRYSVGHYEGTPQMQFMPEITPHGWAARGFNKVMVFYVSFSKE